jgi:hypothetical protein
VQPPRLDLHPQKPAALVNDQVVPLVIRQGHEYALAAPGEGGHHLRPADLADLTGVPHGMLLPRKGRGAAAGAPPG